MPNQKLKYSVPEGQAEAGLSVGWQKVPKAPGDFPALREEAQFFPCVGHPRGSKGRSRQAEASKAWLRRLQLPAAFWPLLPCRDARGRSPFPQDSLERDHVPAPMAMAAGGVYYCDLLFVPLYRTPQ